VERPAIDFGHIIQSLNQRGYKRIIKGRVRAKRSVDITAHSIDISIDCEQGGVMRAAGDLFDERGKGKRLGHCECLIVVFFANTCLTVFIDAHE